MGSKASTSDWLSAPAFADVAGISRRSAARILARALDGAPWRGRTLIVREVHSRGGATGRSFQVRADCLEDGEALPTLPDETHAAGMPVPAPAARRSSAVMAERHSIIQPVLQSPSGSAARKLAVTEAARQAGKTKSTIYRWIASYEEQGLAGLGRQATPSRGRRMHFITRGWDAAVPFDDAVKEEIAATLQRYVRSLWAANTEYGWRWVARMAGTRLEELTRAAGFDGDLRRICKLPHNLVMRERPYRALAILKQDAKRWHDEYRPRVRRTRAGRWPMEIVVGDVHPIDVLLPRPDGSTFTAKLIAFEDWANARVFFYPVFLEKGEGIRQEHVAEAFMAMTQDPCWGLPQLLYLDNGGEYGAMELIEDAMRLNTQVRALEDDDELSEQLRNRRRAIVKARPYNASAKSIESAFSALERGVFSMLPGWIGGNRMAKKTANVGRPPTPYPHGEDAFRKDLQNALIAYETHPQTGLLNGRSPRQALEDALESGWRPMAVSPGAVLAAFARDESRMLRQGSFSYDGRRYTARELWGLPAGTALHLRVPIFGGREEIPVMAEDGSLLCMAQAERLYDVLDREGAREAGRRQAAALADIAAMRADIDPIDGRDLLAEIAEREGSGPVPESSGIVRLSEGMEAVGRALERAPAARRAEKDEQDEISKERSWEARERFLRKAGAAR